MVDWQTANKSGAPNRLRRYRAGGSGGQEGLIWSPVKVRSGRAGVFESADRQGGQGLPEKTILRGAWQECGFCSGTGSR